MTPISSRGRWKPQLFCTVVTCIMTSVTALSLVYIAADSSMARQDTQIPISSHETVPYIIKSHEGKLAVFRSGEAVPELVFDVYLNTLPEYDQKELQAGVVVADEQTLKKLIEDYIS